MTSLLLKVALAGALTLASIMGLVGISGMIIFADVTAPKPQALVEKQTPSTPAGAFNFSGPNR